MGDYEERTQVGEIYVELSGADPTGAQIRLGQSEAGKLFVTQVFDDSAIAQDIVDTSEIAITVEGAKRVRDFAGALRWLADTLEKRFPAGPRPAR